PVAFADFVGAFTQCPVDFAIDPEPTVGGGVVQEPFYQLAGDAWPMDGLALSLDPDFEDGIEPAVVDTAACGDPTWPDFGDGRQGCNFMCTDCEPMLEWEPSYGDFMGADDDETCEVEAIGRMVPDMDCGYGELCPPTPEAYGALNAQWDATLTPFDPVEFMPISCLQSLYGPTGALPSACEILGLDRDPAHWRATECPGGHPTCNPPSGIFKGFTFCPDYGLGSDTCYSCDAFGHCAVV